MKLTTRDVELLKWVNSLGFVAVEHVEEKYGIARKTAYRVLSRLVNAQLMLYEQPIHNQLGLYRVTAYGVDVSGDGLPPLKKISLATLKHDCCVASVSLALTKNSGDTFYSERWLRREAGVRFGSSKDHLPDGHLIKSEKKIAIEVELSVKSEFRLKQSIPVMLIAAIFSIPSFVILVVGILCTVLLCCLSVTANEILNVNHNALMGFFHSSLRVTANDFLISFPLSCLMSAAVFRLHENRNPLHLRLRDLSRGKLSTHNSKLPDNVIEDLLAAITTSAVEGGSCIGVDVNTGERIVLTDQQMNLHTLAVGTTGSGKTTGICNIVESVVTRGLPLIFVDGKGDLALAKKIESLCRAHGKKFYLFSMVGESVKYNPLVSGGPTSKKDRIIALREWSEDHYRKIAEGYLQTVFTILDKANVSVDLCQLSHYLDATNLTRLAQREGLIDQFKSQLQQLHKHDEDIFSLRAEVDNLANSEIGHLFNCDEGDVLKLENALDENATVYFCLQPLAFPSYAELLGKLVINDCKVLASKQLGKREQKKIYAIFDEFSVFAGEQIVNLINQGRSAGIHAILSTQSISDIAKQGGDALVGQVVNNCNNFLIQRQNNPKDAETLANIVGTKNTFEVTSQVSGIQGAEIGNVKSVKEYWLHPDEIKRLKIGEVVVVDKHNHQVSEVIYRG